jgi:cytidyltransferase-like protein
MIVSTPELSAYRGRVTLVDGGFDPFHHGHVAYFEAAASLGLPVLCNVSPDDYVARKHVPVLKQPERAAIIDAVRWISYTHLSQTATAEVLGLLGPRFYAKGEDWRGKLPPAEIETCAEHGIEVVYLDTVLDSSTTILERYAGRGPAR